MRQVSLAIAKDKFSEYAAAAAGGEEIVITRHGRPYAKLVALDEVAQQRREREELLTNLHAYRTRMAERGERGLTKDEVIELVHAQRR
jgi:prevent-host-death family protein